MFSSQVSGSDFGRMDFSRFLFLGRRIFSRIFSPDFFSSFLWEKCPEKSCRKIPGKILQNLFNKNPRHISAEGPGQQVGNWDPDACDTRRVFVHVRKNVMAKRPTHTLYFPRPGPAASYVKVARLQSEFCTKDFFEPQIFLREPLFCGSEKSPENSLQISH